MKRYFVLEGRRKKMLFFVSIVLFIFSVLGSAEASLYSQEPTDDSFVSISFPDLNFDNHDTHFLYKQLEIHAGTTPTSGIKRAYLMFDLTEIPDNSVITHASLWLYLRSDNTGLATPVYVHQVGDDSWNENEITWNNQPGSATSTTLAGRTLSGNGWRDWDLMQLGLWDYASDLTDNDLSLLVKFLYEGSGSDWDKFRSREDTYSGGTRHPYLYIEYQPIPIPAAAWLLGSGLIGLVAVRRRFTKS